jgi:sialate O-acetylesterase
MFLISGESNIDYNRELYSCHLENMMNDWRTEFFEGDVSDEFGNAFPFGILQVDLIKTQLSQNLISGGYTISYHVEIPIFSQNGPVMRFHNYKWGEVRWQQTLNHGCLPNANAPEAFFAATYDLTDHDSPTFRSVDNIFLYFQSPCY